MIKYNSNTFFDEDEFDEIIAMYTDNRAIPKALKAAEIALDQHPYSIIFLVRQAQLYGAFNQIHKAFEILSRAEAFEPNNEEIWVTKGSLFSHLNEHDKAIHSFKQAVKISQDPDEIYMMIAIEYENKKDYQKAIYFLKKAIANNTNNELALFELAWCFEEAGMVRESIAY